ncbi:MAG: malto-oligosyltrehalose synthase [Acidobacteriaceae bacterium]
MPNFPFATYRLQLHAGFTFDDASRVVDYLHALGISHVYCSPYLQAAKGSTHGYDVVDHHSINRELGGEVAFQRFCEQLGKSQLGQILDVVPNHMSLADDNHYWWDVLENGPSSRYASYFDIDWQPSESSTRDRVLVPVLGDQYGHALSSGQIKVVRQGAKFLIRYAEHNYPVAPRSIPAFLSKAAERIDSSILGFLSDSYSRLPAPDSVERSAVLMRHRDKAVITQLLAEICVEGSSIAQAIDEAIADLNQDIDALDSFLEQQNYRLAYWRTAGQELSYRRFFDVNSLVGLQVERDYVFAETHELISKLLRDGVLDGLRIDHPDGLRNPLVYLKRLRQLAPDAWIVVEKILEPDETLRTSWPIHGTTGYDFLNKVNGLLVNSSGLSEIDRIYAEFTAQSSSYADLVREQKIRVMQEGLGSDVNRLTGLFADICAANRDRRDYTRTEIRRAIREVAACFPVYRTYIVAPREEITDEDVSRICFAIEAAKRNRQDIDTRLFDFLGEVLCLHARGHLESEFVMRFQQFTGPVMAKGVEDTVFYCYNRLVSLNEVGADPSRLGVSVEEFHQHCLQTQQTHPYTMLTLSTHDTKRSEDVRSRLNVLSEIPMRWRIALRKWSRMNQRFRINGMPDANTEYLYYQTLIGAWPISADRMLSYMQKAVREAKQQTSWTKPNIAFEAALDHFIFSTLEHQPFTEEVNEFVNLILSSGRINSLSQTLLKYTAPGVPDLYQGSEIWDLSLVDPDNRREVDYEVRRGLLDELSHLSVSEIMQRSDEGLPKLWTIHRALQVRREKKTSFGHESDYQPLYGAGPKAHHLIAFMRGDDIAVLVPRHPHALGGRWINTSISLPDGVWKNQMTGTRIRGGQAKVQAILDSFPVALLTREG